MKPYEIVKGLLYEAVSSVQTLVSLDSPASNSTREGEFEEGSLLF